MSVSLMSSFTMLTSAVKPHRVPDDKDKEQSKSSLTNPEVRGSGQSPLSLSMIMLLIRAVKRRRSTENGDISNRDAKRPQLHDIRKQTRLEPECDKDVFIKTWLSTSGRSLRISPNNNPLLREISDDMPRKTSDVLPSPSDTLEGTTSSSRKSVKSTASVSDTDYRNSLGHRNIYIERQNPPTELIRHATRIISRRRASPEMDDAAIQKLREESRKLQTEPEDVIIRQLAPDIIPAMKEVPDQRLAMNSDQPWCNSVPVPLDQDMLTNPLPLPKPKPDLAFGYSETAFTRKQLKTIELLVDDQFGRSYAVPDRKLRFPFLNIEFKSQAKNGTHFIATNQVAGAGAITLNGNLEFHKRSFGTESFDFDEPQFFSVTMDHQLACLNVHWLSAPAEGGQPSFHVEGLSKHLLDDANGLRAITRAIKNILDYGLDVRLRKLCEALDAYRERVILERKAGTTERHQEPVVQTEPQPERRRRSGRGASKSSKAAGDGAGQQESK